jgi:wobble nucleotide-excising tRNase
MGSITPFCEKQLITQAIKKQMETLRKKVASMQVIE